RENERVALARKAEADEQRDRAELLGYAARLSLAQQQWKEDRGGEALALLGECPAHLRGWEHRLLWSLYTSNQRTLTGHAAAITSVSWSRDGKRLLSGSMDRTARVWDVQT